MLPFIIIIIYLLFLDIIWLYCKNLIISVKYYFIYYFY